MRMGIKPVFSLLPALTLALWPILARPAEPWDGKVPAGYTAILRLIHAKDYDGAVRECRRLIADVPEFDGAYKRLADAYKGKNAPDQAGSFFQSLLSENPANAYAYYGLGLAYRHQKDYKKAIAAFEQSIAQRPHFAGPYSWLVDMYDGLNRLDDALPYMQGLAAADPDNAAAYYGLGYIFVLKGAHDQALTHLERALAINPEILHAYKLESEMYFYAGDFHKCRAVNERLLAVATEKEDLWYKGEAFSGLGAGLSKLAEYSKAIDAYLQALKIQQELGHAQGEGASLNGIGTVYDKLGNFSRAISYFQRARVVWQRIGDRRGEGTVLHNIGVAYAMQRRYAEALTYYRQALQIQQGTRRGEGYTLSDMGLAYAMRKDYVSALDYFERSLAVSRAVGDRLNEVVTLGAMGDVWQRQADYHQAIDYQKKALELARTISHKETLWKSNAGLARSYEKLGQLPEALGYYESSIQTIERMRNELQLEGEQKAGFLHSKIQVYEWIIHLLYTLHREAPSAGYDRMAFAYAERAKARAFLDTLAESKARVRKAMSEEQIAQRAAILREISSIQTALYRRKWGDTEKKRLDEQLKAAEDQLDDFNTRLRATHRPYAELQYPATYDLERAQKDVVGEEALLLEFILGDEQSYLWLISGQSARMVGLPKRSVLEAKVRAYHKRLSAPPQGTDAFTQYYKQGADLFNLLLGPVKTHLDKSKKLVIVPDGILCYLPFETLIPSTAVYVAGDPAKSPRPMIDDYDIAYAPSASVLGSLKARTHTERDRMDLLAYGDPVFQSRRGPRGRGDQASPVAVRELYSDQGLRFEPLPNTRQEVEGIAALYTRGRYKICLSDKASERAVKEEDLSRYRQIHFATHGVISEDSPGRSGLVLSPVDRDEDGILQMNEIFNLDLEADLVVLSACRSGLGKLVRGEGIVGLTRAFMYAGADSLVVSLWSVNDESTAEFMKAFYRQLKAGRSRSDALRRAKRTMLRSSTPAYHFPYFWAPFVLIGRSR